MSFKARGSDRPAGRKLQLELRQKLTGPLAAFGMESVLWELVELVGGEEMEVPLAEKQELEDSWRKCPGDKDD